MVHATINEANLAPLLRAVNHSDSNDNEGFFEEIKITQEYCSYPIPEKYQLSVVVHEVSWGRHLLCDEQLADLVWRQNKNYINNRNKTEKSINKNQENLHSLFYNTVLLF